MKLIKELRKEGDTAKCRRWEVRRAARTILLNAKGEVAIINVTRDGYYKIPGGGIEDGEDIRIAVEREASEEAGCKIKVQDDLGIIIEYRPEHEFVQISFCFVAKVTEEGKINLTEKEREEGFILEWHTPEKALELMEARPNMYHHWFMATRDYEFMKEYISCQK